MVIGCPVTFSGQVTETKQCLPLLTGTYVKFHFKSTLHHISPCGEVDTRYKKQEKETSINWNKTIYDLKSFCETIALTK